MGKVVKRIVFDVLFEGDDVEVVDNVTNLYRHLEDEVKDAFGYRKMNKDICVEDVTNEYFISEDKVLVKEINIEIV